MSEGWAIEALGIIAGLCTTGSFVPQVLKTWREGETGAISTRMYVIISVAFVLWLAYGVVIGSWPMIVFNILNLALGGMILAMKFRAPSAHGEPPPVPSAISAPPRVPDAANGEAKCAAPSTRFGPADTGSPIMTE